MFDTNFTFLSSAGPSTIDFNHCTSADISPFTSRCSSPQQFSQSTQGRTQRDTRYDAYRSSRQSITALTAQLESHALIERRDSFISEAASPATSDDQDEGYYEGPDTPATSVSDLSTSDFDPTLWDLSMSEVGVTSSPRPSLSLEAQSLSSYTIRRRQRQALVRLQCLVRRTPDLAMLIEECHPSSLPLPGDAIWAASSRSNSTGSASAGSGRIEKERYPNASVRKMPRMRKRLTR